MNDLTKKSAIFSLNLINQKKEVKKPAGAKPGFVVYYTNYSMTIAPDISSLSLIED